MINLRLNLIYLGVECFYVRVVESAQKDSSLLLTLQYVEETMNTQNYVEVDAVG